MQTYQDTCTHIHTYLNGQLGIDVLAFTLQQQDKQLLQLQHKLHTLWELCCKGRGGGEEGGGGEGEEKEEEEEEEINTLHSTILGFILLLCMWFQSSYNHSQKWVTSVMPLGSGGGWNERMMSWNTGTWNRD